MTVETYIDIYMTGKIRPFDEGDVVIVEAERTHDYTMEVEYVAHILQRIRTFSVIWKRKKTMLMNASGKEFFCFFGFFSK